MKIRQVRIQWRHRECVAQTALAGAALWLLLSPALPRVFAAERKEWVAFTNCQYVATKDNDGDSFRVKTL